MSTLAKYLLLALLGVGALLAGLFWLVDSAFDGLCAAELVRTVPSPDTRLDAVLYELDCGATTGFATEVALVPHGAGVPRESGNVLIADDGHGTAPLLKGNVVDVRLKWVGPTNLELSVDPRSRLLFRTARAHGVTVHWRYIPPASLVAAAR